MPREGTIIDICIEAHGTGYADLNSVLSKTHALLSAFHSGPMNLRLADLSRRSGVSKTSAYRLAEQLVDLGMLERGPDGYQLGISMFELGNRVPMPASMRSMARPTLVDLCSATRSTIHVAVVDGFDALYVEKIGGRSGVHGHSAVGGRLPLTCTASGKVLLADHPDGEALLTAIADRGLVRLGSNPHDSLARLRNELEQTRERRYGIERQEVVVGMKSFAVAVKDAANMTIAALSATVPVTFADEKFLLRHLWAAAGSISRTQTLAVGTHGPRRMPRVSALAG